MFSGASVIVGAWSWWLCHEGIPPDQRKRARKCSVRVVAMDQRDQHPRGGSTAWAQVTPRMDLNGSRLPVPDPEPPQPVSATARGLGPSSSRYAARVTESTTPHREVRGSQRTAALLTLIEALVLLAFTAFYGYEMASGATNDLARAATSGVLILVFAVALGVLAWGWSRGANWPRTPTILWNALLLPVAWSLRESGRTSLALAVAALAVASIVAALATPARRTFDDHDKEGHTGTQGT